MVPPFDRRKLIKAGANLVDAEDWIGGAKLVEMGLHIGRADVVKFDGELAVSIPEWQQIPRDLLGKAHQFGIERALDEKAFGDFGIGFGRIFTDERDGKSEDIEDLITVGAASLKEVKIGMREADPLPFDRAPTQKGGAALGAAVAGTPFALEAFEVGIRDGMLNGDDARRDAVILPEGVAIPFGHGTVTEQRNAGGFERREAVKVVGRMPAAKMDDFNRQQRHTL